MDTIKNILIALSLIMAISSCSKEDDEVPLADPGVSASDFDAGFVGIALEGNNARVDSILYTNTTKGFSFNISPSSINFTQGVDTGLFYKPLLNGNTGDDVKCCVYVNTASMLGVSFSSDSIILIPVPAGEFCHVGKY